MNKYDKLLYKIAKYSHVAVLKNSNCKDEFLVHYRKIKFAYKRETYDYLKDILKFCKDCAK